jgi:hypothetical protein
LRVLLWVEEAIAYLIEAYSDYGLNPKERQYAKLNTDCIVFGDNKLPTWQAPARHG